MIKKKTKDINGILLLDKRKGISSNQELQEVKKLLQAKKAGHTGCLDPLASGLLMICLGKATKFSSQLLDADKKYIVKARLGMTTTTADKEGTAIKIREIPELSATLLSKVLSQFNGKIKQIPPMYSALKHKGKPLYYYARQGITIERAAREVTIYNLKLLDYDNNSFTASVHCSKGTYVRTLVEDIGEILGCGAHIIDLRRTAIANYRIEDAVSYQLLSARLNYDGDFNLDSFLLSKERLEAGFDIDKVLS